MPGTGQDASVVRRSDARERLVSAAARAFYAEGITTVGVDRLVAEAGVTKATFYRHFRTKDDLVVAYLRLRDEQVRQRVQAATATLARPGDVATALAASLGDEVCGPGFRGCAFINAAAEYPNAEHPVRRVIAEHRQWFRAALTTLLRTAGHPRPEQTAAALIVLRDGVMTGGYLDDPDATHAAMVHAADRLLDR